MSKPFSVSAEVADALAHHRPVVALESTIISHGLPRPRNHEAALEFEQILRDKGVTPATIAVLDGVPQIGLDAEGVRRTIQFYMDNPEFKVVHEEFDRKMDEIAERYHA